jgi:hypothetical protein
MYSKYIKTSLRGLWQEEYNEISKFFLADCGKK